MISFPGRVQVSSGKTYDHSICRRFDSISTLITTMGGKFASVANPIAVVALIFCGIKMLMASDPQSVRSAKQWIIVIIIGLAIINLAGPIVDTIQTLSSETITVPPVTP